MHEFGHFVFAKLFGIGVKVFSLGFGRRVFGVVHNGTDYRVSLLPIGGYVLMEGADPFQDGGDPDADPSSPTSFLNKPVWQRLLVVSAGPVFNLMLPVVVFAALYVGGEPQVSTVVGQVRTDTPAAQAGLEVGDTITEVAGRPVAFWDDLYQALGSVEPGGTAEVVVQRAGGPVGLSLPIAADLERVDGKVIPDDLGFTYTWQDTSIGVDDPTSPAGRAGLRSFDFVKEVAGQPVTSFQEMLAAIDAAGGPVELTFERVVDGEVVPETVTLTPAPGWTAPTAARVDPNANAWGLYPGSLFIHHVVEDSAAEAAGLQVGDRVLTMDGRLLGSWGELVIAVSDAQQGEGETAVADPVDLELVRNGRIVKKSLTPRVVRDTDILGRYRYRAMIGIGSGGGTVAPFMQPRHYSVPDALKQGAKETWGLSVLVVEQVGKIITGKAAPSKTLGGPIQIFRDAGRAAEEGIFSWARMMGMLSISLGIINFLPVPVLDGGQFLFYLVEGIRGRPLSLVVRERAQQVGVLFLVGLMFMVLIFDVNRWLSG
ncbi:MAG: RIP metalloprotease RseP [Alphaproteobacteria bacterium]|nr:RIP metalloprotease RseP [Alphaproteobacteria bacterium]